VKRLSLIILRFLNSDGSPFNKVIIGDGERLTNPDFPYFPRRRSLVGFSVGLWL